MITLLKSTIQNNLIIKIFSLILGYCLWSFLGGFYLETKTISAPIYFYNVPENKEIISNPELINIEIRGKRSDIKNCSDLALHINAESLKNGSHKISPSEEHLFLPKNINLVHYKPLMISLKVTEKLS